MKEFWSKFVGNIYRYVVGVLFVLITVWLFTLNIFCTSYIIPYNNGRVYNVKDSVWLNLGLLILFCVLLLFLSKARRINTYIQKLQSQLFYKKLSRALLTIIFIEGLIVVFAARRIPSGDQYSILKAAYQLRVHDNSAFVSSGYVGQYPNQLGIVTILYIFASVFGDMNYLAFSLVNLMALVGCYKFLGDILEYVGLGKLSRILLYLFGIVFLPLIFYSTYVYGTLLGLAFSLAAIVYELKFLKTNRVKDMILSALFIGFAVMIKNNYLIFMIGMVLHAIVRMIKRRKILIGRIVLVIFASVCLFQTGTRAFIEYKSGEKIDQGTSSWAWIAMGLQYGNQGNGWYNGYNSETYRSCGYDTASQEAVAKQEVIDRLEYFFVRYKKEAAAFFLDKCASEWNNPSFEGLSILMLTSDSDNDRPLWLINLLEKEYNTIYWILDFISCIVLFGVVLYLFFTKNRQEDGILFEMIIVGGVVFHIIWEAKCQYTLPYFMLFLPISISGYKELIAQYRLITLKGPYFEQEEGICSKGYFSRQKKLLLFAGVFSWILLCNQLQPLNKLVNRDSDTDAYRVWIKDHSYDDIDAGEYQISPMIDYTKVLAITDSGNEEKAPIDIIDATERDIASATIELIPYHDSVHICFTTNSFCIEFNNVPYYSVSAESAEAIVFGSICDQVVSQEWHFKKAGEENAYYILFGENGALTYDIENNTVRICEFSYAENQRWILQRR